MPNRKEIDFYGCAGELLHRLRGEGALCCVADGGGARNVITLGWGLVGPFYHGHPVFAVAVTPQRHSWRFLEEGTAFTVAVPDDRCGQAVRVCGTRSGREGDKFRMAGLTAVDGLRVPSPSLLECPVNVECMIYWRVRPPHGILTPEHRRRPLGEQHTIYFAEVVGTFAWEEE